MGISLVQKIQGFVLRPLLRLRKVWKDLSFNYWNCRIMSDAMEYDLDPDVVERQFQANYRNHYGCEE